MAGQFFGRWIIRKNLEMPANVRRPKAFWELGDGG